MSKSYTVTDPTQQRMSFYMTEKQFIKYYPITFAYMDDNQITELVTIRLNKYPLIVHVKEEE